MKRIICILIAVALLIVPFATTVSAKTVKESLVSLLEEGIKDRETEINVIDYRFPFTGQDTVDEMRASFEEVKFTHPEFFDISTQFGYKYAEAGGRKYLYSIVIMYEYSDDEYYAKKKEYEKAIKKIVNRIHPKFSDLEKILYVHEYLTGDYKYDETGVIHDAYNFFTQKTGVCEAYTLAFTALMQKLDIFCTTAVYDGRYEADGVGHCWNIVRLGNNYYHVDTTQDDPIYDSDTPELDEIDSNLHNFLLCSDESIKYTSSHYYWYTIGGDYRCNDDSYEKKAWSNYEHPIVYCDGAWYEMVSNGLFASKGKVYYSSTIYELDADFGSRTEVKTFDFPAWNVGGNSYKKPINFYAIGNVLYGTSYNSIWSYNPATDEFKTVSNKYYNIYSSYYKGKGVIELGIKDYSNGKGKVEKFQLVLGDTDDDGTVNALDLVKVKKYVVASMFDFNLELCDFNDDGVVSVLDYIALKKKI